MSSASHPVEPAIVPTASRRRPVGRAWSRELLLRCGIAASVLYVFADILASLLYPGYSYADFTFSELLAVGSPVRSFMVALSTVPYSMLMAAFSVGVWRWGGDRRAARIAAALLAGYAVTGFLTGLFFPMNTREALAAGEAGFRNAMHPVGTGVMSLFLLAAIAAASRLFDARFRRYTYATIALLLIFGGLTSLQVGSMTGNLPTPWMGIEERVNIYATMLWIGVLAIRIRRAGTVSKAAAPPQG